MSLMLTTEEIKDANIFLTKYLQGILKDGKGDLNRLRRKLATSYWVIVFLSVVMFILGILLLCVPLFYAFRGEERILHSVISAGFGIADLTALFLYGPIEKIHKIMGDMSQIIIALNNFQSQVGLRLMEMDSNNRTTMGFAAEKIGEAARESIKLIQDYFETVDNK